MANSQHIPGLIRGHEGTIIMVEHGRFEGSTPEHHGPAGDGPRAEREGRQSFPDYKFGSDEIKIPVEQKDMMQAHIGNFLDCMRTRESRIWMWKPQPTPRSDQFGGRILSRRPGQVLEREEPGNPAISR